MQSTLLLRQLEHIGAVLQHLTFRLAQVWHEYGIVTTGGAPSLVLAEAGAIACRMPCIWSFEAAAIDASPHGIPVKPALWLVLMLNSCREMIEDYGLQDKGMYWLRQGRVGNCEGDSLTLPHDNQVVGG